MKGRCVEKNKNGNQKLKTNLSRKSSIIKQFEKERTMSKPLGRC